jgi:membrane associated rhomboid family serine protease
MTTEPAAGPPAAASAPTCYRHPGRETHVRCTRCERPICPDCMVSAAVGFQCPECVREGNKGVRTGRTVFGGSVTADPGYITRALVAVNVVAYLAEWVLGSDFYARLWLLGGVPGVGGVADGEWYRLITSAFLHDPHNPLHVFLNMYALWMLGPPLEQTLGRWRFLVLYLLSAVGGNVASYVFSSPLQPSLGASGAIFGLLGAFFVVSRRLNRDASVLYGVLILNLVIGFVVPRIDWRAHLGGLVTGAVVAAIMAYAPAGRYRVVVQVAGCVLVFAVLAVVTLLRTAQLTV